MDSIIWCTPSLSFMFCHVDCDHAAKTNFHLLFYQNGKLLNIEIYDILSICNIHIDIFSFHFLSPFICNGTLKGNQLWRHQWGGNQWFGAQQFPTNWWTIDWLPINCYTAPTESHNVDKVHGSEEEAAGFIKTNGTSKNIKKREVK